MKNSKKKKNVSFQVTARTTRGRADLCVCVCRANEYNIESYLLQKREKEKEDSLHDHASKRKDRVIFRRN
jgi:hypothetical protein